MSRTNIDIDSNLLSQGLKFSGLKTKRELVHAALESFVKKQKLKGFLKLQGKVKWTGDLKKMRLGRTF